MGRETSDAGVVRSCNGWINAASYSIRHSRPLTINKQPITFHNLVMHTIGPLDLGYANGVIFVPSCFTGLLGL